MTTLLELNDKVILITGGAQGIGEAAARLCAERGAVVYIADVNADRGHAVERDLQQQRCEAYFVQVDVRDEEQVRAAFGAVRERLGRLDALVCAAGILKGAFLTPEELPLEDFDLVLDINVRGVFLCAKYAAPLLEASGRGVMVVLASGAGVVGPSSSLAYAASKGGANGLSMTLEAHLEPRGIRVNTLCPGNIVTDMKMRVETENALRKGIPVETALQAAREKYGTPEGVARIIAFMVSEQADYLRGTVFTR